MSDVAGMPVAANTPPPPILDLQRVEDLFDGVKDVKYETDSKNGETWNLGAHEVDLSIEVQRAADTMKKTSAEARASPGTASSYSPDPVQLGQELSSAVAEHVPTMSSYRFERMFRVAMKSSSSSAMELLRHWLAHNPCWPQGCEAVSNGLVTAALEAAATHDPSLYTQLLHHRLAGSLDAITKCAVASTDYLAFIAAVGVCQSALLSSRVPSNAMEWATWRKKLRGAKATLQGMVQPHDNCANSASCGELLRWVLPALLLSRHRSAYTLWNELRLRHFSLRNRHERGIEPASWRPLRLGALGCLHFLQQCSDAVAVPIAEEQLPGHADVRHGNSLFYTPSATEISESAVACFAQYCKECRDGRLRPHFGVLMRLLYTLSYCGDTRIVPCLTEDVLTAVRFPLVSLVVKLTLTCLARGGQLPQLIANVHLGRRLRAPAYYKRRLLLAMLWATTGVDAGVPPPRSDPTFVPHCDVAGRSLRVQRAVVRAAQGLPPLCMWWGYYIRTQLHEDATATEMVLDKLMVLLLWTMRVGVGEQVVQLQQRHCGCALSVYDVNSITWSILCQRLQVVAAASKGERHKFSAQEVERYVVIFCLSSDLEGLMEVLQFRRCLTPGEDEPQQDEAARIHLPVSNLAVTYLCSFFCDLGVSYHGVLQAVRRGVPLDKLGDQDALAYCFGRLVMESHASRFAYLIERHGHVRQFFTGRSLAAEGLRQTSGGDILPSADRARTYSASPLLAPAVPPLRGAYFDHVSSEVRRGLSTCCRPAQPCKAILQPCDIDWPDEHA